MASPQLGARMLGAALGARIQRCTPCRDILDNFDGPADDLAWFALAQGEMWTIFHPPDDLCPGCLTRYLLRCLSVLSIARPRAPPRAPPPRY